LARWNFRELKLSSSFSIHFDWLSEWVIVLAWSAVDRGFESRSGQTKDYKIDICCFSAKHAALWRKSKDWLVRNQNVSEWSEISTRGLLFQWTSTSSPPLTAFKILVILIDSSCVEQVEEYTCLNTDSSVILVSNIKQIIHNFLHLSEYSERLVGSESECVRMEWNFYPRTVISVN
jgi:hypothetical protein